MWLGAVRGGKEWVGSKTPLSPSVSFKFFPSNSSNIDSCAKRIYKSMHEGRMDYWVGKDGLIGIPLYYGWKERRAFHNERA